MTTATKASERNGMTLVRDVKRITASSTGKEAGTDYVDLHRAEDGGVWVGLPGGEHAKVDPRVLIKAVSKLVESHDPS